MYKKLQLPKEVLTLYNKPIFNFFGKRINTKGCIDFYTTFGEGDLMKTIRIRYLIIDVNTSCWRSCIHSLPCHKVPILRR